jgi:L-ascorbate metabolism protein UlaG (beta-lactamase superfamily)
MARFFALSFMVFFLIVSTSLAEQKFETDVIKTQGGDLEITFIGHGTLMFRFNGKVFHIDPWSKLADYSKLPKADFIVITHEHQDHLDVDTINKIQNKDTVIVSNEQSHQKLPQSQVMKNGERKELNGALIEAVPAYNLVHMRKPGEPYHPQGSGNGYIFTFGDKRVYVAGDTENTPEMKKLENIDVAFLPMNLPYTMTPEMVADAAKAFKPKVLYPYHTGDTDLSKLKGLMKGNKDVEIRLRNMK